MKGYGVVRRDRCHRHRRLQGEVALELGLAQHPRSKPCVSLPPPPHSLCTYLFSSSHFLFSYLSPVRATSELGIGQARGGGGPVTGNQEHKGQEPWDGEKDTVCPSETSKGLTLQDSDEATKTCCRLLLTCGLVLAQGKGTRCVKHTSTKTCQCQGPQGAGPFFLLRHSSAAEKRGVFRSQGS